VMNLLRHLRKLRADTRGVGAMEFAAAAPVLILLYCGGYQLMDAISAYRKVTVTARSLSDLTTRQEEITDDKAQEFMNAAQQVMSPYSASNIDMRITQIFINGGGVPKLSWTRTTDSISLKSKNLTVPPSMRVPNTYLIQSTVTYHYDPVVAPSLIGPLTFTDSIFMSPRRSTSIPMSGSCSSLRCQIVDLLTDS
jgi:Flp pilus assembly protein TadG